MGGGEYIRYIIMIYLENLDFHPFQHSTRFVGGRKWKSNFFGRHLCHWGILEGAWKEISSGLKPLKHRRRQKLPIAPLSSSRFPPFPWKLKTKLGTPELQNSFNNVLPPLQSSTLDAHTWRKKLISGELATTCAPLLLSENSLPSWSAASVLSSVFSSSLSRCPSLSTGDPQPNNHRHIDRLIKDATIN